MAYNMMESRRRIIMWASGRHGRLPDSYQEVEYIDNKGIAYINTGIYPEDNADTELSVRFMPIAIGSNYIFASRNGSSGTVTGLLGANATATMNFRWGAGNMNSTTSAIIRVREHIYTQRGVMSGNTGTLYVTDETSGNSDITTFIRGALPADLVTFKLCAANVSGTDKDRQYCPRVRVYSANIIKNGVCVMDFIPCYRKSDNIAGMYDLVRRAFYASARSGNTFEAGPTV